MCLRINLLITYLMCNKCSKLCTRNVKQTQWKQIHSILVVQDVHTAVGNNSNRLTIEAL